MKPIVFASSLVVGFSVVMADPGPLSQPIDAAKWKAVPCVTGKPATVQDVKDGRAVFVISGPDVHVIDMPLPHCAIWHDGEKHADVPVVCIQAEGNGKAKVIGIRLLRGGSAVCMLSELTLLDEPDERFSH